MGISMTLHGLLKQDAVLAPARLQECLGLVDQALEQTRELALKLRPAMLDTLGLEATLRWLAEHHQQRTGTEGQ